MKWLAIIPWLWGEVGWNLDLIEYNGRESSYYTYRTYKSQFNCERARVRLQRAKGFAIARARCVPHGIIDLSKNWAWKDK